MPSAGPLRADGVREVSRRRQPLRERAPIDALLSATEVNEWAYDTAKADIRGVPLPDLDKWAAKIRVWIADEANPALRRHARRRRKQARRALISATTDSARWARATGAGLALDELPAPDAVDWSGVHDIPECSSPAPTARPRPCAWWRRWYARPGHCSRLLQHGRDPRSARNALDAGDYSGPEGARSVLRDNRVDVAILETARGGMLRRGLGVSQRRRRGNAERRRGSSRRVRRAVAGRPRRGEARGPHAVRWRPTAHWS